MNDQELPSALATKVTGKAAEAEGWMEGGLSRIREWLVQAPSRRHWRDIVVTMQLLFDNRVDAGKTELQFQA